MIRAAAMAYALMICIIMGFFIGMLLLLQNSSQMLQQRSATASDLLRANASATQYFLKDFGLGIKKIDRPIAINENTIFSTGTMKHWGLYKVGIIASFFKNDTIRKAFLLGTQHDDSPLALYLTDYDKPLHMAGLAKITGSAQLPRSGIRRGNIYHNKKRSTVLLDGMQSVSKKRLPKLSAPIFFEEQMDEVPLAEYEETKTLRRDFLKNRLVVTTQNKVISGYDLKGQIVLKATDTLRIKNDNTFDNIVIEAPVVIFESGFKGVVQVYASKGIVVEEDCVLQYPSSLFIDHDSNELIELYVGNNSTVIGGIVLTGNNYSNSLQRLITIEEGAKIVGDVYCYGKTQLKGSVIGTVFTDRFFLKTAAATYENYIFNGTINKKDLPTYFVRLPFYENKTAFLSYDVIKEL